MDITYLTVVETQTTGGGLLLFAKKNLIVHELQKNSTTFEKIAFKTKIDNKEVRFLTYYRQPKHESIAPFMKDLEEEINSYSGKTIILGDVNLDSNSDNHESRRYMKLLESYDYEITNSYKTRNISERIIDHVGMNFNRESCIDNFLI